MQLNCEINLQLDRTPVSWALKSAVWGSLPTAAVATHQCGAGEHSKFKFAGLEQALGLFGYSW